MQDLCGREWTAQEYELILSNNHLNKEEIEVIKGLEQRDGHWLCSRCLNEKLFGEFVYRGERMTYCRECLDFKQINQNSLLYRSKQRAIISHHAHILNADFKLSKLQQEASRFSQEVLRTSDCGLIWAVCSASI